MLRHYDAYIDAWLVRKFPGKTLEELDNIDWLRFRRALEAQRICDIEDLRNSNDTSRFTDEILAEILEHDALLSE